MLLFTLIYHNFIGGQYCSLREAIEIGSKLRGKTRSYGSMDLSDFVLKIGSNQKETL